MADTRKLKDTATELLKKGKFEKAAATLEELIKAEPRETQHRLKLGDAWRKAGERERSIAAYQAAAKSFSDEGQLIKAIAAVKVILEIDPANQMAQRELTEMTERRFAKPGQFLQKVAQPKALGGARGVSELELAEGESVTDTIAQELSGGAANKTFARDDSEALELDEAPPRHTAGIPATRPPASSQDSLDSLELADESPATAPKAEEKRFVPPRRGQPLPQPLQPADDHELIELPIEPEATPAARKPAAPAEAIELPELELVEAEPLDPEPEPTAAAAATPTKGVKPSPPRAIAAEEIDLGLDIEVKPITGPQPIADLIAAAHAEEEVELLSISTDDELESRGAPAAPTLSATGEDLDAAFGAIVDEHDKKPARKVPPRVPLFGELAQDAFVELVNALEYRVYQPGEVILKEGDPGRSFYVIAAGRVRVFKQLPGGQELTLAHLEEGAFFGEMALLSGAPRTATIAAESETEVLEVTDKVLRQLVGKHPTVANVLKSFYRQRLLNNVMAISPLFKDFNAPERKLLMARFRMRQAEPGEALIEQGKKSDGLYVVLHGIVNVHAKAKNGAVELAKLREGDIFGEMSLLTHQPATATVTAAVPSIVLKLPRDQFQEMILTHPQILELVSDLTDQRRSATEAILAGLGPGQDGMAFV